MPVWDWHWVRVPLPWHLMLSLHPFASAFAIPFWPCCFPCSERHPQIWGRSLQTVLSVQAKCSHLLWVLVLFWLLTPLQVATIAEHKALTDDGGTVSEKEASGVWLFYCLAELLSLPSGLQQYLKPGLQASCHCHSQSPSLMSQSTWFSSLNSHPI